MGGVCNSGSQDSNTEDVPGSGQNQTALSSQTGAPNAALTVAIMGAKGLRDADPGLFAGLSDCYCELVHKGEVVYTTQVMWNTLEPDWREEVQLPEWQKGEALEFVIWDKDQLSSKDLLGKLKMESSDFDSEGYYGEKTLTDTGKKKSDKTAAFMMLKIKLPNKDYPKGPVQEFQVQVERGSAKSLGLELDTQHCEMLQVSEVKAGPFKQYNEGADPELQVKTFDFITVVNGVGKNTEEIVEKLKTSSSLTVTIRRPAFFMITIERTDSKPDGLGVLFPKKPVGTSLLITKVAENGPFADWNSKNPNHMVQSGDRIGMVNGTKGKTDALLKHLKVGKYPVMIMRPACEQSSWHLWKIEGSS